MTIGKKIMKIRDLLGFSQEYIAHKLQITQQSYSKLELDKTKISEEKLKSILDILGVSKENFDKFDDKNLYNVYQNQTGNGVGNGIFIAESSSKLIEVMQNNEIQLLKVENDKLRSCLN
jgi:transcriptional regulator with XRE-family HTH domain